MNATYNTATEHTPMLLDVPPTVTYIKSPERVELELALARLTRTQLELTLARLTEANRGNVGVDYTDDMVDILTWGRNAARKQGQTYTNKHNNHGYSWGTKAGKYTCTKNTDTNKLYVNFTTWADIKEASSKF